MLHVTNGDSAAHRLRAAGIGPDVLPWRDVLHEGPVVGGLDAHRLRLARARYVAALGWAEEERVLAGLAARDARLDTAVRAGEPLVLWFEPDLYDMLQLAQILDRLPERGGATWLVLAGERVFTGIAELGDEELRRAPDAPQDAGRTRSMAVDAPLVAAGRALWAAVGAPDPGALDVLAAGGTPRLPALGQAAARLLEHYPWCGSNLNRTERTLLQAVADGAVTPAEAFEAQHRAEERPFMGDATVFAYLERLAAAPGAVLATAGGRLGLTDLGRAVLDGDAEWETRPERWLGGVRLAAGPARWRYDPATGRLASSS